MSRVEELITQLCPNGIAFTELRNVCQIKNGKDWKTQEHGDIPVYGSGGRMEATVLSPSYNKPTVLLPRKGSLNVQYVEEPFWNVDTVFYTICDVEVVEPKFLFYYLKTINLAAISTSSTRPSLTQTALSKIRVPVPPLPVQQEIVRILDKFTQLEAELEAELEARVRQYDHYRTSQFLRVEDAKTCSLGDVAEFKYGLTAKARDVGTHRFLRITDIGPRGKLLHEDPKFVEDEVVSEEYQVSMGDVFMARTGATFGKTMLAESDSPAVFASFLIRIRFDSSLINPTYYWHFAQSTLFWSQANSMVSQGSQPQFNANALKRVKFPVPSISEQNRIVQILDRFDALVNDVTIGLPAEISARRKQFEYYRDKLLTFKELSA